MAAGSTAQAASSYVSLFGGGSFLSSPDMKGTSHAKTTYYETITHQSLDTSFKTGFVVGGSWGIDWGSLRTEIELAYRGNNSKSRSTLSKQVKDYLRYSGATYTLVDSSSTSAITSDLTLNAFSLMANAWYDFHDLEFSGITPYAGGGFGFANVQISGSLKGVDIYRKDATTFAWQVGGGFTMPITDKLKASLDYRYFAADNAGLHLEPGYGIGEFTASFDSHEVLTGLRYTL
jgi:opacity protein-like surface antigen